MFSLFVILFLFFIENAECINYLSQTQWSSIRYILKHPQTTNDLANKCNEIIFQHYKDYAYNTAYDFKTTYTMKCQHIPLDELKLYAAKGLLDAISNYNASSPYSFSKYASIYIDGQLYYGMSKLHPITLLPISKRMSRKWRSENLVLYKKMTNTKFMSNYAYYDNLYVSNHDDSTICRNNLADLSELWGQINNLDEKTQVIMKYKYNFYFKKIRSNEEVGELVDYSSETIRKNINKTIIYLSEENKNKNSNKSN